MKPHLWAMCQITLEVVRPHCQRVKLNKKRILNNVFYFMHRVMPVNSFEF